MTKENTELELIQKLGAIVEYLGELSENKVLFHSEMLLPASREKIKKAAELLLTLTTDDEEEKVLKQVPSLLDNFIPHYDAVKLAQSWNKIKPKFEGKDYDKEVEQTYMDIIRKYTARWNV